MVFRNQSASSQGIDTSRTFRVKEANAYVPVGQLVKLRKDDESVNPYFALIDNLNEPFCIHWSSLEYATTNNNLIEKTMYPKTLKAAQEELKKMEKELVLETNKRDKSNTKISALNTAISKLKGL